jgi:hypothetical protein
MAEQVVIRGPYDEPGSYHVKATCGYCVLDYTYPEDHIGYFRRTDIKNGPTINDIKAHVHCMACIKEIIIDRPPGIVIDRTLTPDTFFVKCSCGDKTPLSSFKLSTGRALLHYIVGFEIQLTTPCACLKNLGVYQSELSTELINAWSKTQ